MALTFGLYMLELRLERIPTAMWVPFGDGILNEASASSCSRRQRRRPGRRNTRTGLGLRLNPGNRGDELYTRGFKPAAGQVVAVLVNW